MNMRTQITGRDVYIESEALVLAIGYIQSLPIERQSWSNTNDMCRILRAKFYPGTVALHMVHLFFSAGITVDLFPDNEDKTVDPDWKTELYEIFGRLIKQMHAEE
jgi:hypothetical protein